MSRSISSEKAGWVGLGQRHGCGVGVDGEEEGADADRQRFQDISNSKIGAPSPSHNNDACFQGKCSSFLPFFFPPPETSLRWEIIFLFLLSHLLFLLSPLPANNDERQKSQEPSLPLSLRAASWAQEEKWELLLTCFAHTLGVEISGSSTYAVGIGFVCWEGGFLLKGKEEGWGRGERDPLLPL